MNFSPGLQLDEFEPISTQLENLIQDDQVQEIENKACQLLY